MEIETQTLLASGNTLAILANQIAYFDGDHVTAIPGLTIYRRSNITEPMHCIYGLGLGLTVQGRKRVTLGEEVFEYTPGQSLVTSLDLPVVSHVTHATAAEPFLGIGLALDARTIMQCAADMNFLPPLKSATSLAMSVVTLDQGLVDTITRLLKLLQEPELIPIVAPLIKQEIIVRLLKGEHGPTLRHLITIGSQGQQIARIITWLKQHYAEDLSMDDLASKAHMSPSTFRQHFRAVAGLSPLQYLKHLRLQGARQLLLNEDIDATSAALRVGYESPSQFSREYTRLFGAPPIRDIRRAREVA
ncbi:AraC family transcriptional regulator N-terminal domain-containing protein [Undibacterium sp. SXout20W]|uniref:AraC family transcriptional regulator n=1 Tax=Undibacterium sp. SXout20W TaxID=3413051 RepID=UPI003BF2F15B